VIRLAVLLWAALALPGAATQDGWPAIHDVTGVAADDVLNIRERPDASSPIVGQLAPDATVEVIRPNERLTWGLVNAGERTGWVSLRYLQRRPGQWDGAFPEIASCFGTEPFWSLRARATRSPSPRPTRGEGYTITARSGSENRRDSFHMIAEGAGRPAVARSSRPRPARTACRTGSSGSRSSFSSARGGGAASVGLLHAAAQ
jgi:hypothetical protein